MALTSEALVLIETVATVLPKLPQRDASFAASVIASVMKYKSLSDKQASCLQGILVRSTAPAVSRPTVEIGDLSPMIALLDRAAKKLKHPAIVLRDAVEGDVKLYVAGASAKAPGTVSVQTNDGYPASKWFGRINRDGTMGLSLKHKMGASMLALLRDFSASPAETAARHGKLTGRCCFCNSKLEDERSTNVGYGPVCSKNYGMPWGK